jgi:hypothetical protein
MQYSGIILHQSLCSSINGKGYDFYIRKDGSVIPASEPTESEYLHVCISGDFSKNEKIDMQTVKEQIFVLHKLILSITRDMEVLMNIPVIPHSSKCPGPLFPWYELVISLQDGYH